MTIHAYFIYPPAVHTFFDISRQRWLTAVSPSGKADEKKVPPLDHNFKGVQLPYTYDLTARDSIQAMYNIIYRCMGLGSKKATETYKGEDIETAGNLFSDIPRYEVKRHPGLRFLYRHAINWRANVGKSRSRSDEASALAFQCYYGYKILWDVTSRILVTDAGSELRQSLADFASGFCRSTVAISTSGAVGNVNEWVDFDHDIAEELSQRGTELNDATPLIEITDRIDQLAWAERRSSTYASMQKLVDVVAKMPAAQNGLPQGPSQPVGMPSFVAKRLKALLLVCIFRSLPASA